MPRRANRAVFLLASALLLSSSPVAVNAQSQEATVGEEGRIPPEVAVQKEDYASARHHFRTKLVWSGPAPESDSMPPLPNDATLLPYSSGGRRLAAWISRPSPGDAARRPAVIFVHGGFSLGPHDWEMTQAFRDSGFVVMTPTLRGENRQDGAFTLFYDEVDDVLAAADELARQPFVDGRNLFVAGHSNGGTLAMLAAMSTKRFRAAASFSGSPDQIIFCRYGFEGSVPFDSSRAAEYEMRSPLAYAGSFHCPTRILYGTREPHFLLSSQKTAALAKEKGLDVEAAPVVGSHFSALAEERRIAIEFFRSRLKP